MQKYTFANSPFPARAGGVYGNRKSISAAEGRTTQYTVIKVRLHPTPVQTALIEKTFGCCRYLWNRMLADAREFYAATDLHYIPTPAHYKREAPFLRDVDSQPLCTVHQNLRKAYLNFFRDPSSFQYPKFKRKKDRADSFTVYCRQYRTGPSISLTSGGVRMPKLGCVKAVLHRRPLHWWSLVSASVSKTRSGKYFCSLLFKYSVKEAEPVLPAPERTLGLWASPVHFYLDSLGRAPEPPELAKSREKLRRMQQRLSRMQRGSRNYEDQLRKLRLLHEHAANQRRDFLHKESRRIANAWDAVCTGEGAAGSAPGFGMFRQYLQYKLERQGKRYIVVDGLAETAEDVKRQGLAQICA